MRATGRKRVVAKRPGKRSTRESARGTLGRRVLVRPWGSAVLGDVGCYVRRERRVSVERVVARAPRVRRVERVETRRLARGRTRIYVAARVRDVLRRESIDMVWPQRALLRVGGWARVVLTSSRSREVVEAFVTVEGDGRA